MRAWEKAMFGDEALDGDLGRMKNSVCHLKFHLK